MFDMKNGGLDPFPRGHGGSEFKLKADQCKAMTKAEEKILRRLARLRPDLVELVEPANVDYGYVPSHNVLCQKETLPSGNVYHVTVLAPATASTCENKLAWEADAKWFEGECKKGNYRKVKLSFTSTGKIVVVGPYNAKPLFAPAPTAPPQTPASDHKAEAQKKDGLRGLLSRNKKESV